MPPSSPDPAPPVCPNLDRAAAEKLLKSYAGRTGYDKSWVLRPARDEALTQVPPLVPPRPMVLSTMNAAAQMAHSFVYPVPASWKWVAQGREAESSDSPQELMKKLNVGAGVPCTPPSQYDVVPAQPIIYGQLPADNPSKSKK